ncbi:MAG: hypothetical protein OEU76_00345 [Cyclobacteriaceae bacterium]|nr:hypothetical protein [Cyclobacteriaceae bacterium]
MISRIITLLLLVLLVNPSFSQDRKMYTTTSGELIFSFADIAINGADESSVMRFSPTFNVQNWVNIDKSDKFGFFTGFSIRNVGVIFDDPSQPGVRYKARSYNFGIPIGFKIGNLSDKFLFAGYELELPFNYKEKVFIDESKEEKDVYWFSNRVNTFNHSVMVGVQLPYGATIKFKYYLTNFFNKDFKASDGQGGTFKPYEDVDVNIFYFSLNFNLLRNTDFYYNEK